MVKLVKYQTATGAVGELFVDLEHDDKGSFPDDLRSQAQWNGTNVWPISMGGEGGSIMATPPLPDAPFGKLLIGSLAGMPNQKPYWAGQDVQPVVDITTSWLYVGHVDEILMWVATNKVLYADPWTAANLLHGEIAADHGTNSIWFGLSTNDNRYQSILDVVVATNASGYKLTALQSDMSASTNAATVSNGVFAVGDYLRVDAEILKVTATSGTTVTVTRAEGTTTSAQHTTGSKVYAYTETLKLNLPFASDSVVNQIALVTNELRQALGSYSATFVPIPVIFAQPPGSSTFAAGTADAVNCLVGQNGVIYYAYTGCSTFENYITNALPGALSVDEWIPLHCWKGEVHCGTTAQRELNLQTPWWQQTAQWE